MTSIKSSISKQMTVSINAITIRTIIQLLKKSTGFDFEHYKINSIYRRVKRRMLSYKLSTLPEYLELLQSHSNEVSLLHRDLLINVTSFFRDTAAINILQGNLLPGVIQQRPVNAPLRIWVPACSSGEEAYSLAIIIVEVMEQSAITLPIQIFATDVNEVAIEKARAGIYSVNEVANVSSERLKRFFVQIDDSYRVVTQIRKMCVFAVHNIITDPPFSDLNIISCCNLLIYLDNILHEKLLRLFHKSLNETGYLILGKSETAGSSSIFFKSLDKKAKIYTPKKNATSRITRKMQNSMLEKPVGDRKNKEESMAKKVEGPGNLAATIDAIMVAQHYPASVVINDELEILQYRGAAHQYLKPMPGRPGLNILKMVPRELAVELRRTVFKSIKTGQAVKTSELAIQRDGQNHHIALEVIPLKMQEDQNLLLVIFDEPQLKELEIQPTDARIKQLENELITLREDLGTLLEAQETANEQLQTANEEIVSSNEELQSINEELETSKEEIESSNEELITTNPELIDKNEQLAQSKQYVDVVIATIREAVIILDRDFRVRSANKAFYRIFKLKRKNTEGNLIYEIGNKQWDIPKLRELLSELLQKKTQIQGMEVVHTFPQLGEKTLVLDARKILKQSSQEETILLSIEDITEHRKNEQMISEREVWFRNMNDNVPVMIWVAGVDREFTYVNKTWLAYTGRSLQQEINSGWLEDIHPDDVKHYLKKYKESFSKKEPFRLEYRMRRHDGVFRWQRCTAVPTFSSSSEFTGFTGSCIEIHTEKLLNEELEKRVQERTRELHEVNNDLKRSNNELEQFAYVASHDLQEPLRKILTFSDQLEDQHTEQLSDEGREYIGKIITSSQRMSQLIDDLLDFSRITQSQNGFVETDLNMVLQELLIDFELIIKEKNAKIIFRNRLPIIQANQLQMQQLFQNLLSNSLKFSATNKKTVIELSCRQLSSLEISSFHEIGPTGDRAYYEIVCKDNGIGFNQEYSDQVFTIFQRLHDRTEYPGTGIGLALCRKIIDNHHGMITVRSEENKGTAFFITLPDRQ